MTLNEYHTKFIAQLKKYAKTYRKDDAELSKLLDYTAKFIINNCDALDKKAEDLCEVARNYASLEKANDEQCKTIFKISNKNETLEHVILLQKRELDEKELQRKQAERERDLWYERYQHLVSEKGDK